MKPLSLLQLNVQGDKHWNRIEPFLRERDFDVLCLEELNEEDAKRLEKEFGLSCHFVPRTRFAGKIQGTGIFSKTLITNARAYRYAGIEGIVDFVNGTEEEKNSSQQFMLVAGDIVTPDGIVTIAATHFVWTPDGNASPLQHEAMQKLLEALEQEERVVLCGDFNAPRKDLDNSPGEIFSKLAAKYTDNIPQHYTTSIDGDLHRSGPLELMVDGIFSTPHYAVSNVERFCGLSDHCGFTAEVSLSAPSKILEPNTDQVAA